jgi:FSR family fosmidomycin resistance protein-like MFS transporter
VRDEAALAAASAAPEPRGLGLSARTVRTIGILPLAHAVNDSYAYVLQALLPAIIASLGLTLGLAGGLVSLYQLTSSLVQPFFGYLADRHALRWPVWAGVAGSGVAAGLLGLAPSYVALIGLVLLGGLGTAIFHPVAGAMVGASAPPHARGRWLGLFVTSGNFGGAFGPLMVGALVDRSGPTGTWPILLPALLLAGLAALLAPRGTVSGKAAPPLGQTLRRHGRVLGGLILVITLRSWVAASLATFIPLLGQARGLSVGDAAQALTAFLFAAAVGGLLGGFAADRGGRDRVIVGSLLLSLPFGLLLALRPAADPGFFGAAVGCGFFLNASFVVLMIRGQESVPGSTGMMTGVTLGLTLGLGGLAVTPMALLAEWVGLPLAAAVAVSGTALTAAAMRLLPPLPPRGAET